MVELKGLYFKRIPKSSHLGPLLFTRPIIELRSIVTHSRVPMYADEVKLCYHIMI